MNLIVLVTSVVAPLYSLHAMTHCRHEGHGVGLMVRVRVTFGRVMVMVRISARI